MTKIHTLDALVHFLEQIKETSAFSMSRIQVADQSEWQFRNGALSHQSDGFFHVTGLKTEESHEEHLMLYQPQSALTGLAMFRDDQEVYVLLQARVEPGNTGIVQYGPTIQSTSANYNRMHGGKETNCLSWFHGYSTEILPLGHSTQLDIGQRYFLKSKVLSYVEVNSNVSQPNDPSLIWVSLSVVFSAALSDNLLNTDLRSLMSVFDWDAYVHGEKRTPGSGITSDFLSLPEHTPGNRKLIPLHQLQRWQVGPYGITDIQNNALWVDLFQITSNYREKSSWVQPLYCATGHGEITLCYRISEQGIQYLLQYTTEPGIPDKYIIHPTSVIYPEENNQLNPYISIKHRLVHHIMQSEEGGRFYKNENRYQIIELEENVELKANQFWVNSDQLKSLLKTSEKVSIQLRCACSLLLHHLNPRQHQTTLF